MSPPKVCEVSCSTVFNPCLGAWARVENPCYRKSSSIRRRRIEGTALGRKSILKPVIPDPARVSVAEQIVRRLRVALHGDLFFDAREIDDARRVKVIAGDVGLSGINRHRRSADAGYARIKARRDGVVVR